MKSAAPNERVRLVFISHAHEDETLAGCLASFLCAAVDGLSRDNVFLSSEAGHGVAPGESIRTAVLREAANAPVMIVVLTGSSLLNPWVWLEAGCRMGDGRQGAPLFVAPTIENLSQTPVADLMTLALDDNGQLHDLLKPIAKGLERRLVDFNSYKTAMDELTNCARAAESPRAVEGAKSSFERNKLGQVNRWIVAVLPIAMLVGVIGLSMLVYGLIQVGEADKLQDASISNSSDAFVTSASEYLRLQGQVVAGEACPAGLIASKGCHPALRRLPPVACGSTPVRSGSQRTDGGTSSTRARCATNASGRWTWDAARGFA